MPPPRLPLLLTLLRSHPPTPAPRSTILGIVNASPFGRQFSVSARRYDTRDNNVNSELPSAKEEKRSSLAKNFSNRLDHLQAAIFTAGQKINDLTGYSGIETLKRDIEHQEQKLSAAKALVTEAKAAYKAAIARRSASQKEVNELLTRKNTWTPTDLERFTELYRSDHANEQAEIQAQNRLNEVEKEVDSASSQLSKSILTRYHEEQVWSDKIRRASTWGTWMLMGFNVVLFVIVQVGLEPWKRRRLVRSFEDKVRGMLKEERQETAAVTVEGVVIQGLEEEGLKNEAETVPAVPEEAVIIEEEKDVIEAEEGPETIEVEPATTGEFLEAAEGAAAGENEILLVINPEEGMDVLELIMHRLNGYFAETRITVPQVDVTLWIMESFAVGVISTITFLAVSILIFE